MALIRLFVAGSVAKDSQAHGGGGVHVDVGNPHGYYGNYGTYYGGYGGYGGGCGYGGYPNTAYYGGWGGGRAHWHDTTHSDYHPGEFVRHRNHYHYVPGHYDLHEEGHWDYHD